MPRRVNYITAWPEAAKAMLALQDVVNTSGLETSLVTSSVSGRRRSTAARIASTCTPRTRWPKGRAKSGSICLEAWRDATMLQRPRAGRRSAWTEAVTLVSENHVPDDVYDLVRTEFSDRGTGEAHAGRCGDQRLEPVWGRLPAAAGASSAAASRRRRRVGLARPLAAGVPGFSPAACGRIPPTRVGYASA